VRVGVSGAALLKSACFKQFPKLFAADFAPDTPTREVIYNHTFYPSNPTGSIISRATNACPQKVGKN
jgi:hypothetical protein